MRHLTALLCSSLLLFACGEPSAPITRVLDPPDAVSRVDLTSETDVDASPVPDAGPDLLAPDASAEDVRNDATSVNEPDLAPAPDLAPDAFADAEPDLQPDVLPDVQPDRRPRGDGGRKMADVPPPDAPSCPQAVYCIDDLLITSPARVRGGPVGLGTTGNSVVPYGTYHLTDLTVDYLDNTLFTGGQAYGAIRIGPDSITRDADGNRCGDFTTHLITDADNVRRNHRGAGLWNSSSGRFVDLCSDSAFTVHSYYGDATSLTVFATGFFGRRDARMQMHFRLDGIP